MSVRDVHPPETLGQARRWDRVKRNAVRFGLCQRCAAQFAWAHQENTGSFGGAHSPCDDCKPLIASLPVAKVNGWRTVQGDAGLNEAWRSECATGSVGTPTPGNALTHTQRDESTDSDGSRACSEVTA